MAVLQYKSYTCGEIHILVGGILIEKTIFQFTLNFFELRYLT